MEVYYAWEVIHWQCFFLDLEGLVRAKAGANISSGEGLSVMEVYSAGGGDLTFFIAHSQRT